MGKRRVLGRSPFAGTMDQVRPQPIQSALRPRVRRLVALSSSDPIRWRLRADPVQKRDPASGRRNNRASPWCSIPARARWCSPARMPRPPACRSKFSPIRCRSTRQRPRARGAGQARPGRGRRAGRTLGRGAGRAARPAQNESPRHEFSQPAAELGSARRPALAARLSVKGLWSFRGAAKRRARIHIREI